MLEHLSPEALRGMLAEAARVLAPGGALFVYTHVRKNAPIAVGLRWINGLARQLERLGLIDMRQERLRKSDHLNPLRDIPELERVAARAGFRIARIRYYTPIVGGFVENIMMRMAERAMARRAAATPGAARAGDADADARGDPRSPHDAAKQRIAREPDDLRGAAGAVGRDEAGPAAVRPRQSGPFFALLVEGRAIQADVRRMHGVLYCAIDQIVPGTVGGIGPRDGGGGGAGASSATRCTCSSTPGTAAASRRTGSTGSRCRRRSATQELRWMRRRCAWRASRASFEPDVVIERYYNFGGEGIAPARGVGARHGARGQRAGDRLPGLDKAAASTAPCSSSRCAAGASGSARTPT